jgi:hypothetical protein
MLPCHCLALAATASRLAGGIDDDTRIIKKGWDYPPTAKSRGVSHIIVNTQTIQNYSKIYKNT